MANKQEPTDSAYVRIEESFVNFYKGKTIETTSLKEDAECDATQDQKTTTRRHSLGDEIDETSLSDASDYETAEEDPEKNHEISFNDQMKPGAASTQDVENDTSQKTATRRHSLGDEIDATSLSDSSDYETAEEDQENDFNDQIKPQETSSPRKDTPSDDHNTDSALNKDTEDSENYGKHCFRTPLHWYRLTSTSSGFPELWWYQQKSISDDENELIQCEKTTTRQYSLDDETDNSLSDSENTEEEPEEEPEEETEEETEEEPEEETEEETEEEPETVFMQRMKFRRTFTQKKVDHSGDQNTLYRLV